MSIQDLGMLFEFIGGLGMFLYGMNVMADGLQKSAGGKMKKLMEILTKNRFIAVLVGAGITTIIQSSSATTVMVVGFVNAGMLSLAQAVGVIMGANIGTTITAWIVSMSEWGSIFKPEFFSPVLVGIGAFCILFSKTEKKKKIGEILVGFGILFIGLTFMSGAITPYRDAPIFAQAFTVLGKNPILAIITGAVVTAIIQSSSASVGILQTLAMNGVVNWQSAIFITLGQNIGTCVTALISSAGAGKNAKRASVIHLLFNTLGAIIFGIVMFVLFKVNTAWASSTINSVEISVFHTVFNVTNTIVLFPFANLLVKLSEKIVKGNDEEEQAEETVADEIKRRLDRRLLASPALAIEAALKEVNHMGQLALENTKLALMAVENLDKKQMKEVHRNELVVNELEKALTAFLAEINNQSLTEEQHLLVKNLMYTINDIERVGDHADNIGELAESMKVDKVQFSEKGIKDLEAISKVTLKALVSALEAREKNSLAAVKETEKYEDKVDALEEELREKHIQRLSKGKCVPESGVIFLDIISNLERISDHASNIAGYVASEK